MATRKKTPTAAPDEADLIARDFVYMGCRLGVNGNKIIAVGVLEGDKLVEKVYGFDKARTIGAIYTGAKFTDNQVLGLTTARYTGSHWQNDGDVIAWTAEHRVALQEIENMRADKEAGRVDRIEELLLPLRIEYFKASNLFNPYKTRALEAAVITALRTQPRQYELDKKSGSR